MGKRGPKPDDAAALAARGSKLVDPRGKRRDEPKKRPVVWDRKRPGPEAILDGAAALEVLRDRAGFDVWAQAGEGAFDEARGRAAVEWIHTHCTHTKGRWANKALELSPLQQGIIYAAFGFERPDGTRRFRECFLGVPRKWGKTTFVAAVQLLHLDTDGEDGAECYALAGKREQAALLWEPATRMIRNDEHLTERFRIYQHSVVRLDDGEQDGSSFKVVSAEARTAHGYNPHAYAVDEVHAQKDANLIDAMDTAVGARSNPFAWFISTSDYERESICNEMWDHARKVRDGDVEQWDLLVVIFEASPEDDWTDPEVWARVNPHYPATPSLEYMEKRCAKAKLITRYQSTFLRLNLNVRTGSDVAWLDMVAWDECAGTVDPETLRGRPCYASIDVSTVSDLTGLVLLFPEDGNAILSYGWATQAVGLGREERHILPSYVAWEREGFLGLMPGNRINQSVVRAKLNELSLMYDIRSVAVDMWQSEELVRQLAEEDGHNLVAFGQGYKSMTGPSKQVERMILGREFRHDGHPVLRWCVGNAQAVVDTRSTAENIKPGKAQTREKARAKYDNKIDLLVCLVMCVGLAMVDDSLTAADYDDIYAEGSELGITV